MYRPSYNVRWTPALIVAAILALFPAALAQQKVDVGKSPGGKPDERVLQLIIEQAGEEHYGAVDAKTVIAVVTEALEKRKGLPEETVCKLLLARGVARLKQKDFGSAKEDADELCGARPKDAESRWLRGMVHWNLNEDEAALADVKAAVELQPKSPKMHCALSFVLRQLGDVKGAMQAALKATELDPRYAYGHYHQAGVLVGADPEACVKGVEKYLELSQGVDGDCTQVAYEWRGISLCQLNRHRDAIPSLLAAHKLNPRDLVTNEQLAVAYLELGKFHLAAYYAEELIRIAPDRPGGYDRAARAYAKLGRMREARAMVKKGVDFAERNRKLLRYVAEAHAAIGEYEKARDYYDKAIARDRYEFFALLNKAELLATCPDAKIRDGKAAVELAEAALNGENGEGCPDWLKWRPTMALAEAHAECGHFDKAVEFAKEAIRLGGPDFARRQEFLDKLALFEKKMPYRMKPISD